MLVLCCCSDDDTDGVVITDSYHCYIVQDNVVCNSSKEVEDILNTHVEIRERENKDVYKLLQEDYSNSSVVFVSDLYWLNIKSIEYDKDYGLVVEYDNSVAHPLNYIPHCDIIRISPKIPSDTKIKVVYFVK